MNKVLIAMVISASAITASAGVGGDWQTITFSVDVLGAFQNTAVRSAPWYAKPVVATWEFTKASAQYTAEHPFRAAGGVVATLVVKRLIERKFDDDVKEFLAWAGLREENEQKRPIINPADLYFEQTGDGNELNFVAPAGEKPPTVVIIQDGDNNEANVIFTPPEEEEE